MSQEIHSRVLKRMLGLFDATVMQNNLRGLYVETMVAELLGQGWQIAGGNWAGWDIEHDDGTRVEVKQSAARQTWSSPSTGATPPSFSIRTPQYVWQGAEVSPARGRPAHLYVFAWHDGASASADHRVPAQWQFFVVQSSLLPDQKSIGLNPLRRLAAPVCSDDLRRTVDGLRIGGMMS